jgi:hypothetical protein
VSPRSPLAAAALTAAALAIGGCGDDEQPAASVATTATPVAGASGASGPTGVVPDCVGDFNARADDNLPRLARLSHEPGDDILVGTFASPEFSAETYDVDVTDGDGTKTAVAAGDCAVTEVSDDLGTLYVFVVGDDREWHNLLVTDPDVVLADDPASQLDNLKTAQLEDVQSPNVPKLVEQDSE